MKLIIFFFIAVLYFGCTEPGERKVNTNLIKESEEMDTNKNDSLTVALIKTNMGSFEVELFPEEAPKTVENFVGLAEKGYYQGVVFHRVIDGFVIQGGDPTGTGRGGQSIWGKPFQDEFNRGLKHDQPGVLSMANAGPNTNGSQFFVTLAPTPWLDGRHSVFGKVINGLETVTSIGKVAVDENDKPLKNIAIEEISIEKRAR